VVNFPTVQWIRQNPAIDPSGLRHLLSPGAGFLRLLGTGPGGELDFGQLNTTGSGAISITALTYARVSDFGDASGVFNMRFYWHNTSAWGAGTYRFLEKKSIHFISNVVLNDAAVNTPTVVPLQPNMFGTLAPGWTNGQPWMSGVADGDVTNYLWLSVLVGADVSIGTVGGAGAGSFRARLLYDFS
jgi:hypothetical protein